MTSRQHQRSRRADSRRSARLTVTFHKVNQPRPHSWWEAVRPTGGHVRGGWMPIGRGRIPHDLTHLAIEAHFGIEDGIWGLLARGATYKRGTDRRPTKRGRELVRDNRESLHRAEQLANAHGWSWAQGGPTPAAVTLDRLASVWAALPDGGRLTVAWPTLDLLVE